MKRTTRKARTVFHSYGHKSIVSLYIDALHRLASSSFARLPLESSLVDSAAWSSNSFYAFVITAPMQSYVVNSYSMCFVLACIMLCDWDWWQWQQAIGLQIAPRSRNSQWRHSRPGPHLRWENVFVQTFGDQWKEHAASDRWPQWKGQFRDKVYGLVGTVSFEQRFYKPNRRKQRMRHYTNNHALAPVIRWSGRLEVRIRVAWKLAATAALSLIRLMAGGAANLLHTVSVWVCFTT